MASAVGQIRRAQQLDSTSIVVLAAAAAWTGLGLASYAGKLGVPHAKMVFVMAPLVVAGALISIRRPVPRPVALLVGWTVLTAAALYAADLVEAHPLAIAAVPVGIAAGLVAERLPSATALWMIAVTGFVGTIIVFTDLAPAYLVDVPLIGMLACLLWGIVVSGQHPRTRVTFGVAAVTLFLLVSIGQTVASTDVSTAQESFHNSIWHVAALPAIALAGWSVGTRVRVAHGYLVIAAAVAGYAVYRLSVGPAELEREQALVLAPINLLPNGDLGLFGSMTGRQSLAAWCGMAVPFCVAFLLFGPLRWRMLALTSGALTAVALIGTQTRVGLVGALIGCAAVLALYSFSRGFPGVRLNAAAVGMAAVLFALGAGFTFTESNSQDVGKRYSAILNPRSDVSFEQRLNTWGNALDDIQRKPFGHGIGSAGGVARTASQSDTGSSQVDVLALGVNALDNSYLKIGYEQGALPMLLFAAAILLTVGSLARAGVVRTDPVEAGLAIAACGAFAAFAINLMFTDNIEDFTALTAWMLGGLGLAEVVRRHRSRSPGPPDEQEAVGRPRGG